MKEMNMNAVRCSHYPPDKSFLYLCDSLGIYVLDELAGWQNAYATLLGRKLVAEMVLRDVNHPTVIFWSNGNEGGTNKALDDDFLTWDFSKRRSSTPTISLAMPSEGLIATTTRTIKAPSGCCRAPISTCLPSSCMLRMTVAGQLPCRFLWRPCGRLTLSGGGFVWAFVDEGIMRTDLNKHD
jgi:beta-galactosidase/beta-glucuronidase